MGSYRLRCLQCGRFVNDPYRLRCGDHTGLLRPEYATRSLDIKKAKSVFKFYDWLPISSTADSNAAPVVFRNERLNKELGLKDMWVAFTGYYPERGAFVRSCSFKEMESLPTMVRIRDKRKGTIVVASAGNTGRAFAQTSNDLGMNSVIIVPERSADRI
ncbi:MAG: hypothetical protein LBV13_02005 [Methanomassiliicoccaceae archaeon]|nr:hypothetical protein [Methanomassiliicoccaceae archaeon]